MFTSPAVNEALNVSGKFFPRLGSVGLSVRTEAQEQRDTAEYGTGFVALFMQPSDVALDWLAEPMGSDAIQRLRFDEVFFQHSNLLSESAESRLPRTKGKKIMFPVATPTPSDTGPFRPGGHIWRVGTKSGQSENGGHPGLSL
jgi:hypothetical protein